jgi:hypothetical protein
MWAPALVRAVLALESRADAAHADADDFDSADANCAAGSTEVWTCLARNMTTRRT